MRLQKSIILNAVPIYSAASGPLFGRKTRKVHLQSSITTQVPIHYTFFPIDKKLNKKETLAPKFVSGAKNLLNFFDLRYFNNINLSKPTSSRDINKSFNEPTKDFLWCLGEAMSSFVTLWGVVDFESLSFSAEIFSSFNYFLRHVTLRFFPPSMFFASKVSGITFFGAIKNVVWISLKIICLDTRNFLKFLSFISPSFLLVWLSFGTPRRKFVIN